MTLLLKTVPLLLGRVYLFYYVDHQQTRDIVGLQ
jgi:hypothetical protein